jgi:hypothetical protein
MTTETMHELDRRNNDGIDVRLLWDSTDNSVYVTVDDVRTGDSFALSVDRNEDALEVFRHPYAYAAWQRVETRSPVAA